MRSLFGTRLRRRSHHAHAVVTGAGSGIGRAFAVELARRGGQVVCADIDKDSTKETVRLVESHGGRALAVHCDVSIERQVWDLSETEGWLGRPPDLVVNNAGIGAGGRVVGEMPLPDWRRVLAVHTWGVVHGCHVFVPWLRFAGDGELINVSSAAAFAAAPRMGAYNVSKAAVLAVSETVAAELSGSGVAVTVLCPDFVSTNIIGSGLIDSTVARTAERLMRLTGASPEHIARRTLDAHDRGRLYVIPRLDAQLIWRTKRMLPAAYTRAAGLLGRLLA